MAVALTEEQKKYNTVAGEILRQQREKKGLTLADVQKAPARVSRSTWSNWEHGRTTPTLSIAAKVLDVAERTLKARVTRALRS
jgi:transcriptional regulator with XRE-family HTH domain